MVIDRMYLIRSADLPTQIGPGKNIGAGFMKGYQIMGGPSLSTHGSRSSRSWYFDAPRDALRDAPRFVLNRGVSCSEHREDQLNHLKHYGMWLLTRRYETAALPLSYAGIQS